VDDPCAEKIAHNNSVFRHANDEISQAATEHGLEAGRPVPFICECSDVRCVQIIRLTPAEYARVRSNPRWFAHAVGHETDVAGAVRTVETHERYVLVEKTGHAGAVAADLASQPPTD
jgi:hypothetical protein